jgi:hypothetical protein
MSMWSKHLQTAGIRWFFSFGDWAGGNNFLMGGTRMLQKCCTGPQTADYSTKSVVNEIGYEGMDWIKLAYGRFQ